MSSGPSQTSAFLLQFVSRLRPFEGDYSIPVVEKKQFYFYFFYSLKEFTKSNKERHIQEVSFLLRVPTAPFVRPDIKMFVFPSSHLCNLSFSSPFLSSFSR